MGTTISCLHPSSHTNLIKLVFCGGSVKLLAENHTAGELLSQFRGTAICDADAFYLGQRIPVLSTQDELITGKTYFVLPLDRVNGDSILTAASLVSMLSPAGREKMSLLSLRPSPFDYRKDGDGRTLIKVVPSFIAKAISDCDGVDCDVDGNVTLCSTPELRKHYEILVGSRNRRSWSPKLQTISESKKWVLSPAGKVGLDWRKSG